MGKDRPEQEGGAREGSSRECAPLPEGAPLAQGAFLRQFWGCGDFKDRPHLSQNVLCWPEGCGVGCEVWGGVEWVTGWCWGGG